MFKEIGKISKREFIERVMNGEVLINTDGDKYYYDESKGNPFRWNPLNSEEQPLKGLWDNLEEIEFRLKLSEPEEPIIERRWKWRREIAKGATEESLYYMSDSYIKDINFEDSEWVKIEDKYIDIEIKQ